MVTRTGGAGYRGIESASRAREVDRSAWAGRAREIISFETEGVGTVVTPTILFAHVYEREPFFTFGVELLEGSLTDGDFPITSAGVSGWQAIVLERGGTMFKGATVWAAVSATTSYHLLWRFSFEGTVIRNRHYIE